MNAVKDTFDKLQIMVGPMDEAHITKFIDVMNHIATTAKADLQATIQIRLPEYNPEAMKTLFPDIQSEAQARQSHEALAKLQSTYWRSPDTTFEHAIGQTLAQMSKDEIGALPDSLRLQWLNAMGQPEISDTPDEHDHKYMNEQRVRLALGEEPKIIREDAPIHFDARRSISLSPAIAKWQIEQNKLLQEREADFYQTHPEYADIKDRWQKDYKSITIDEKKDLMERLHTVHAETFNYPPALIVQTQLQGEMGVALNTKFGDSVGLILLDEKRLKGLPYDPARGLIMHESDHIAQFNWLNHYHDLPDKDPRKDFVERMTGFTTFHTTGPESTKYGTTAEARLLYHAKPAEVHAYLLHDPLKSENAPSAQDMIESKKCLPSLCP